MTRRASMRRARGFTLMEGLIASGLLAIMGAFLATSLSSSIDAKEIVEDTSNRYHLVRQAMTRMVDEISMAYLTAHNLAPEQRVQTVFKGERDRLEFASFGHVPRVEDAKESDSRELAYFLGTDDRTGLESLMRRVQPNLDDEPEDGGREQTLMPNVNDLQFEYWEPTTREWKDSWDSEDSATLNRLPTRVRITFTAKMVNDEEQTFTTQSKIWLFKPWAFR